MGLEAHTIADAEKFQINRLKKVYRDAAIDAALTVAEWQLNSIRRRRRIRHHVARALDCYHAWGAIQAEIVRRNVAAIVGEMRQC